jgi:hypothetical protein
VTGWLDPVRAALDEADGVQFFLRDDDIGWDDPGLFAVLDVVDAAGLPIDLAAIPCELGPRTAAALHDRHVVGGSDLLLHQHGLAHANHEREGRKHEFGPSRSAAEQREDLAIGRALLTDVLEGSPVLDAGVFTPPWNRTSPDTPRLLAELGFGVLSRDLTAGVAGVQGLAEVPVTVDWFATRTVRGAGGDVVARRPVTQDERGGLLAAAVASGRPVGLMLHHAVTGTADLADLADVLGLVARHPAVHPGHLAALAGA